LDGLECIHPSHNWKLQKHYTEIAEKNSLLLTGGSDFHGYKEQAYSHVGVVSVAMKHVQKMKRMTDQRKLINKPK
ncbi:MAG TPA: PHP domain-containing protein, partial [Balneolaceae bacterium]|nr:PHP domain-containing protein [Balneolaceae bacterium]